MRVPLCVESVYLVQLLAYFKSNPLSLCNILTADGLKFQDVYATAIFLLSIILLCTILNISVSSE